MTSHCLAQLCVFGFFNWRITVLQYRVGLCHASTWISHRYTHVPSLLNRPPSSHLHPTPLGCHTVQGLSSLCHTANPHWLSVFTRGDVYVSVLLFEFIPLSPPPTVPTSLFSMSVFPPLSCRRVHQYHLSRFHIYVLTYDICVSLSNLLPNSMCYV